MMEVGVLLLPAMEVGKGDNLTITKGDNLTITMVETIITTRYQTISLTTSTSRTINLRI